MGQKRQPEAPRFRGVALGACDLGSFSVAQTWEAGDSKVREERSRLCETGGGLCRCSRCKKEMW